MLKNNRAKKIIILAVCIILMVSIVPRAKTIMELSAKKQALEQQKAELAEINKERKKELAELRRPETVERIAREQLGMIKAGEKVMVHSVPQQER